MKKAAFWLSAGAACAVALSANYGLSQTNPPEWKSRAIEASQGPIKEVDGKKVQVRYNEGPYRGVSREWSQYRTHAYGDTRPEPAIQKAEMPTDIKGDPAKGKALFTSRAKGPCTACHVIRDDIWPMGNVGLNFEHYGELDRDPKELYQMIYDIRTVYPESIMPPWGTVGMFTPEEIVHLVAFLQTQKGPDVTRKDPNIDPETRYVSEGFGDNLDPTNNPGVLLAEAAAAQWTKAGPNGKACADCHQGGAASMKGVATKYPKFVAKYGRVMAIEDFLAPHTEDTMGGNVLPAQGEPNIHLAALIKLQSSGMPLQLDLDSPEAKAALQRGEATFKKRVGLRNHACVDCHTEGPNKGGGKFLGGRKLGTVNQPLTMHFPTFRTNFTKLWDTRKRFQWCMLPLGMNFIPGDSAEYAELELYLASFAQGKPVNVPGMGH